ncbi:Rossmann-like and DUF2520 domain-containing protein [Salisaeta longa]|uniref:Rossmann-like and DUF2520 domain-containing protein n=1 Tax=Salisaeta longa TaxID=503170 RepID=UPI0003B712C9|nr:Rossmann-like and DUF2520 domain-containing protein [Salisaeta longa]
MPFNPQPLPLTIVGAGAVGTALAQQWTRQGGSIAGLISRRRASVEAAAQRLSPPPAHTGTTLNALPGATRIVALAVPDDAIASVAEDLAAVDHPWHETLAFHLSGLHPAARLAPLAARGAATVSVHPLQTIPAGAPPTVFEGAVAAVEGPAAAKGHALARWLGLRPVAIASSEKAAYHAAAALAANGLVALASVAQRVLEHAGVGPEDARAMLGPLLEATAANVHAQGPARALTGPVARGDVRTVAAHLNALPEDARRLYTQLAREMLRLTPHASQQPALQTLLDDNIPPRMSPDRDEQP